VTRSSTIAPRRSRALRMWRRSESLRRFLRTRTVVLRFVQHRPRHVSRTLSPRRTGETLIEVNFV
jgi:hypothetical protein